MKKMNDVVKETLEDFQRRIDERRSYELRWRLNMNFYVGNQFCTVGFANLIEDCDREFFWQEREVFNHIAPKIDIRLAKLAKIKPKLHVAPASDEEVDRYTAKLSKKILNSVSSKLELSKKIGLATKWSEICGTSFYKVFWDDSAGSVIAYGENGEKVRTGDVAISVCSPFEIYPDSSLCASLDDCQSVIHAKVYSVDEIKNMFNVTVEGGDINVYALNTTTSVGGLGYSGIGTKVIESVKSDASFVIEKYVRPNKDYPNGRLIVIAGDTLIFDGELPYVNGKTGERDFPFIKQVSCEEVGSFWGVSLIERLIPIQRAYNAVKNRKHEYLNRLTLGVLAVEDGSVDIDNLEEEGLAPGKILVYRQGATPPQFLDGENLPTGFDDEEEKLLQEFTLVSGINEIGDYESVTSSMSGTAIELMLDENDTRISFTSESIKNAVKMIGKHVLRLYKQFATIPRLEKITGENGDIEIFYFQKGDITSDDVEFDTETENNDTISQRRNMIYTLLEKGILYDDDGKLSPTMKSRVLEMLGFGVWENAKDIDALHIKRADGENIALLSGESVSVKTIDDHALHISEHIAFMLSGEYEKKATKNTEDEFLRHIDEHKKMQEKGE